MGYRGCRWSAMADPTPCCWSGVGGPSNAITWQYRQLRANLIKDEVSEHWTDVPGGAAARSHRLTGLVPGKGYTLRLRAVVGSDPYPPTSDWVHAYAQPADGFPEFEEHVLAEGDGRTEWRVYSSGMEAVFTIPDGVRLGARAHHAHVDYFRSPKDGEFRGEMGKIATIYEVSTGSRLLIADGFRYRQRPGGLLIGYREYGVELGREIFCGPDDDPMWADRVFDQIMASMRSAAVKLALQSATGPKLPYRLPVEGDGRTYWRIHDYPTWLRIPEGMRVEMTSTTYRDRDAPPGRGFEPTYVLYGGVRWQGVELKHIDSGAWLQLGFAGQELHREVPAQAPEVHALFDELVKSIVTYAYDYPLSPTASPAATTVPGAPAATPAAALSPAASPDVVGVITRLVELRTGPATLYPQAGTLEPGYSVTLIGRTPGQHWVKVTLGGGLWVERSAVDVNLVDLTRLPFAEGEEPPPAHPSPYPCAR